jgi:hypothetical protein
VFSPDDRRVATASEDKTARIWDATNGQQLAVIVGHTDAVGTVAFSPNGAQLVTASDDKTARVWDSRSAPLAAQIRWTAAAQFDELSDTERLELGLASTGSRNEPRRAGAGRERPEALSRSAVAEESAASQERDLARRNAHLLEAFRDYSAAAELARRDGLPDDVWQDWRYRRASLARILARDGLMEQVAETYASVIRQ